MIEVHTDFPQVSLEKFQYNVLKYTISLSLHIFSSSLLTDDCQPHYITLVVNKVSLNKKDTTYQTLQN